MQMVSRMNLNTTSHHPILHEQREKIRHNLHLQIKKKNATDDDDDDDETNTGGRISFSSARC